jgi:hypothetical protein
VFISRAFGLNSCRQTQCFFRSFALHQNPAKDHPVRHFPAVALHFAYYNFCRVHSSLRITPAMEVGITYHIWTIAELLSLA